MALDTIVRASGRPPARGAIRAQPCTPTLASMCDGRRTGVKLDPPLGSGAER
jgi:hypothetical protein